MGWRSWSSGIRCCSCGRHSRFGVTGLLLRDLFEVARKKGLLGGSWVVISGVISPLIRVITTVTLLITPLITTHELPSTIYYRSLLW